LNDDFSKLPQNLQDIINDDEKRKKLVIYINPPYAEATTTKTVTGTGENKSGVTTQFKINELLKPKSGAATNEIFALFMTIMYEKIPDCILGQFSTLKFINGSNFKKLKDYFLANYVGGFIVPSDTFDNVKGKFPIGFTIWNTADKSKINTIQTDVYDKNGNYSSYKNFYGELPNSINKWTVKFQEDKENSIGTLFYRGNDFQNQNFIYINLGVTKAHDSELYLNKNNIIIASIYFVVRHCIDATWLNDRDQFLYPNEGWQTDLEFQNDCLAYTLFHGQNKITSQYGVNHWIPFTEQEVNAQAKFASNFMTNFIKGKIKPAASNNNLFSATTTLSGFETLTGLKEETTSTNSETALSGFQTLTGLKEETTPTNSETTLSGLNQLKFSEEATAVFDAGRELWKYYHSQQFPFTIGVSNGQGGYNANASLYDIREYFQGRNDKGRMNPKSTNATYTQLISNLRENLKVLAKKIEPKVYEYGFLKE
jgi:hypothetical protein